MKKITFLLVFMLSVTFAQALVYNVTVPEGTKACYIAGEMNDWEHQAMTKVDETHYTIDLPEATTEHKYKYCSGPDWKYVEKGSNGEEIGNRTYAVNDVVAQWAAVYIPPTDIVIKVKVPASWTTPIKIHYWGDKSTEWPGTEMTQDGDWWTYIIPSVVSVNIVINDGTNQTGNIEGITESTCYKIAEDKSWEAIDCSDSPTGVETNMVKNLNITVDNGKITALLTGKTVVRLYSISGQLIVAKTVFGNFTQTVDKGAYILTLDDEAHKIIVK